MSTATHKSLLELDDLTVATLSLAADGTDVRTDVAEGPAAARDNADTTGDGAKAQ